MERTSHPRLSPVQRACCLYDSGCRRIGAARLLSKLTVLVLTILCSANLAAQEAGHSETSSLQAIKTVQIEFSQKGESRSTLGEVILEYADGSLLLLTPDGQLWTLHAEEIQSVEETDEEMVPATSAEIYELFRNELPDGFSVYKTRHYVMVYNTSTVYVRWVGNLFEKLYTRFHNFWRSRGIDLDEPRFPLVAIVFSDKASYLAYAERDVGDSAKAMIGYYNMKTNRIVTYDLTGVDGLQPQGRRVSSTAMVQQILSQPTAERTVATIVHEAVHQLSYNGGLQVRLADNPLWLSEGLAMFFEAPDRGSSAGWGTLGKVNYHNLRLFAQYLPNRPANSLHELITDDAKFKDAKTAGNAYPESWALTYFLIKTKSDEFAAYLQELSRLPPLGETEARERIEVFRKHFGDMEELNQSFLRYIRTVR